MNNFNSLPPKPEYISEVIKLIALNKSLTLHEAAQKSKYSRTQLECALVKLIRENKVKTTDIEGKVYFSFS